MKKQKPNSTKSGADDHLDLGNVERLEHISCRIAGLPCSHNLVGYDQNPTESHMAFKVMETALQVQSVADAAGGAN